MRIIFILLHVSLIFADDFDSKYSSPFSEKLVDEQPVEDRHNKFAASLRYENVHFCTASLLSNKHALTTAFCLRCYLNGTQIPKYELYSLVAGRQDINNGSAVFKIQQVQVHRRYNYKFPFPDKDLGIITMKDNNITESEYVGWGCWPEQGNPIGEILKLSGWENVHDMTKKNKQFEYMPKKIAFRILGNSACHFRANSPIICAQSEDGKKILSENDFGAPLSLGKFVLGILVALPDDLGIASTFLDIARSSKEIERMMSNVSERYRTAFPRTKVRCDWDDVACSKRRKLNHKHQQNLKED